MLGQILGEDRVYGTARVYLNPERKQGLSRDIEWTDVYLQRGDSTPENVSRCNGVSCMEPALSPDGRRVVFVKSGN
jgi:Tol biopolymer transport system component